MAFSLRQIFLPWLILGAMVALGCETTTSTTPTTQSETPQATETVTKPTAETTLTSESTLSPASTPVPTLTPDLTLETTPTPIPTTLLEPTPDPTPALEPTPPTIIPLPVATSIPPLTPVPTVETTPSPTPTVPAQTITVETTPSPTPTVPAQTITVDTTPTPPSPVVTAVPTVSPTSTADLTDNPVPEPLESYRNDRLGLALSYPARWSIDTGDPAAIPITTDTGLSFLVQSFMVGPTTLDAQLAQIVDILAGTPGLNELSRTALTGDGAGSHLSYENTSIPESSILIDFIIKLEGARLMTIFGSAPGQSQELYNEELSQLIDSVEINLDTAVGPIDADIAFEEILNVVGDRVTSIRQLPALSDPKLKLQTRESFISEGSSDLLGEESRAEIELLKDLCVILDLCSPTDDLWQAFLDLHDLGVLGFYDTDDQLLTVVTSLEEPDPLSWLTYAHEYTHALQDQEFDLSTFLAQENDGFDSSKASLALLEGDANLSEYLFYESLPSEQQKELGEAVESQREQFSKSPAVAQAPPIIRETVGWEHGAGPEFVFRLYLQGGFEAINNAYENVPRSTEQILHTEKYLLGEQPHLIALPDLTSALGDHWQQRDTSVLGELLTTIYLATFLSLDEAKTAAEGWGGDQYGLFKNTEGRLLLVLRNSWDTETDAQEFYDAYLDLVTEKSQEEWNQLETGDSRRLWTGDDISVFLTIDDSITHLVIGPDLDTVQTILTVILADVEQPPIEIPEPTDVPSTIEPVTITMASTADVISPSTEFDVTISVDPQDRGLSGVTIRIQYDPAVVQPITVTPGALLGDDPVEAGPFIDEIAGTVEYTLARVGMTQAPTQPGLFATLRFAVLETAPTGQPITLTMPHVKIADEDAQEVVEVSIGEGLQLDVQPPLL